MFCAYCRTAREANEAPCPNCGAPSTMLWQQGNGIHGSPWGNSVSFPQQTGNGGLQVPYDVSEGQLPWQAFQQGQQDMSMLPVPYQGNTGLQQTQQGNSMQVAPVQDLAQAVQSTMTPHEEELVYVPPMYTKPRPIIPRYRIFSGFLSVIIVSLLMCTGAGYYAKASGKLDAVGRIIYGNNLPQSIRPNATPLPDPPDKVDRGPAYMIIPSATTTSHLIAGTSVAAQTDRSFKAGVSFTLTYSVVPPKQGRVIIKWYTNNVLFTTTPSDIIPAGGTRSGIVQILYSQPTEGMVELYWNDQLAQRLYFVVRS